MQANARMIEPGYDSLTPEESDIDAEVGRSTPSAAATAMATRRWCWWMTVSDSVFQQIQTRPQEY